MKNFENGSEKQKGNDREVSVGSLIYGSGGGGGSMLVVSETSSTQPTIGVLHVSTLPT